MDVNNLVTKHKNKILHAAIIIFALIIANNLYKNQNAALSRIEGEKINENKKNEVLKTISKLERRLDLFRKNLGRKDSNFILNNLNAISKESGIKILSIKPDAESRTNDYVENPFILILKAPGYHVIGQFISKLENNKEVFYIVDTLKILRPPDGEGLNVNLKINSISIAD